MNELTRLLTTSRMVVKSAKASQKDFPGTAAKICLAKPDITDDTGRIRLLAHVVKAMREYSYSLVLAC